METNRARRRSVLVVLLLLLLAIALLLVRCSCQRAPTRPPTTTPPTPAAPTEAAAEPKPVAIAPEPAEVLTPATLAAPTSVAAGATFAVEWIGPDNRGDFVTVVRPNAPAQDHGSYQGTDKGKAVSLVASTDPGTYEVRYVTGRSRTILARAPIEVLPTSATLDAPAEVELGATFAVTWTGPNNTGDYITIVPRDAADAAYGTYVDAARPAPQSLTAPAEPGDAEVRYVLGQGRRVLARRAIRVLVPRVSLSAPAEAIAGSVVQVEWTGPNNAGDYVTAVPPETPDGQYANYTPTSSGSPLNLLLPITPGAVELRYMTGQGNKVLARRALKIVAAQVTLVAPPEAAAGSEVSVTWTGPNNAGDYITACAKSTPDGQYGHYTMTAGGSPLRVRVPASAGECEIRYMTGQGDRVLARIPIKVTP